MIQTTCNTYLLWSKPTLCKLTQNEPRMFLTDNQKPAGTASRPCIWMSKEEWRIFRLNHDSAKIRANKRNMKRKFHTELPTRDEMLNKIQVFNLHHCS